MKQKNIYSFDDSDEKAVQLFTKLGMPKNIAKTLLYVSQVDECKSGEVERGANLRQPDVSIAMQELRERGWVDMQSLRKKKGKGRPIHMYKTTMPLSRVMEEIKQEKTKEIEAISNNMAELENIFNNRKRRMNE